MSHFYGWVLVPKHVGLDEERINAWVTEAMAPYDENMLTAPHYVDCYCIGGVAGKEAGEKGNEKFGTWDEMKKKHNAKKFKSEETNQKAWEKVWAARQAFEEGIIKNHPMKDKPEPTCGFYDEHQCKDGLHKVGDRYEDESGCGGTGKYLTKANDNASWDWWVIGGRWDGEILGKTRPSKDKGFNFGEEHHQLKYNSRTVASVLTLNKEEFEKVTPFAFVDGDGIWHERGSMGWWGIVRDEKDKKDWSKGLRTMLKKWADGILVGVDCHI